VFRCFWLVLIILLAGCKPANQAVRRERLVVPETVEFRDVVSYQRVVQGFEVTNVGSGQAWIQVTVDPPFFLPTPSVNVAAGGTATVRIGVREAGYDPITTYVHLVGPYDRASVRVIATFDLDADDDGFLANQAGGSDCDDLRADVSPAAPEVCDGLDNDCDGFVDVGAVDLGTWYRDGDGDDFGDPSQVVVSCESPSGFVSRKGDCNDDDAAVNPDATEDWYDGVDQDCDARSDYDRDRDDYDHWLYGGEDCRDNNAAVNPAAEETWYDGVDQDCDGESDYDQDGDGYDDLGHGGDDCDDLAVLVHPGVIETDDGTDEDCDGMIDEPFVVRGDLVFTEVMVEPAAVVREDGQYAEVLNASVRTINLQGMTVDTLMGSTTLGSTVLVPDQVALLCVNTESSLNGGLACDGSLPAALQNADSVTLTAEIVLDEVDWSAWTVPSGAALELGGTVLDPDANDDEASWCEATTDLGSGDLGTPGVVSDPCGQ
jgi:hypothetical protein